MKGGDIENPLALAHVQPSLVGRPINGAGWSVAAWCATTAVRIATNTSVPSMNHSSPREVRCRSGRWVHGIGHFFTALPD